MDDFLEKLLEESLSGTVLRKDQILPEHQLHAIHAQAASFCRKSRAFRLVEVDRKDDEDGPE